MNREKYLHRIGIDKTEIPADLSSLKLLQQQHLLNIPFENLDIHWKIPIQLKPENFYKKIVEENRGGFCYELNGLFYELLCSLGFQSKLISARVTKGEGEFGPEKDHMAILTQIADKNYFVDVGFGSFIAEPLEFVLNVEQKDPNGTYLIKKYDENYFQILKKEGEKWNDECIFTTKGYDLSAFTEMCDFHQTSPDSHFTRNKICSLMMRNGRRTLTDNKFIVTSGTEKKEVTVGSNEEFNQILEREFNIKAKQ